MFGPRSVECGSVALASHIDPAANVVVPSENCWANVAPIEYTFGSEPGYSMPGTPFCNPSFPLDEVMKIPSAPSVASWDCNSRGVPSVLKALSIVSCPLPNDMLTATMLYGLPAAIESITHWSALAASGASFAHP